MQHTADIHQTDVSKDDLESLFRILDIVNVSALWVDKDFKTFKYNNSNKLIKDTIFDLNGKSVTYTELLYEIFKNNQIDTDENSFENIQKNWLVKLRELQSKPLIPSEDTVILPQSGKRFVSRRVFFPDGSMFVVSFDYSDSLLRRDDIIKIAFDMSKSGALCFSPETNEFLLESPYLKRILTQDEYAAVRSNGLFAIIHPDDVDSAKNIFTKSLTTHSPISKNIRIKTHNKGNLWFKFIGRLERASKYTDSRHIITFEDVTEELEIQENLRRNIQDSENKLSERLDFMAKLSHELKTPMNAIVGLSDALLHDDIPSVTRSKLELIQQSSGILLGMLDETLNHAKLENAHATLDLQYVDPRKVIGDICKLWEHQALKKGTVIQFHPHKTLPNSIKLDSTRIGQCLNNLLSNASKFTEYGKIDVIVQPHFAENQSPQLAIAVRDNGIGMTEEQQRKVFQAYKQANETISTRYGGTGLGMSITKDLIELMGGKITLTSKPNKGSLFLIILPMDVENSSRKPQETAKLQAPTPQNPKPKLRSNTTALAVETPPKALLENKAYETSKTAAKVFDSTQLEKLNVLVVDDNETNHIVMSSLLENVVGGIYSAYNGREAIDVLSVEHIDVVLMDIHMPIMDGIEATIAIRQSTEPYSNVRIIALTADPQYQQQRLCVNIGMDEAMAKPVKLVDLIDIIKKTMSAPVNKLSKAS